MNEQIEEELRKIRILLWRILTKLEERLMQVDDEIAALVADVTAGTTVSQSAITLLNGIPALITTAVAAAVAAGATPAQLQALTDLNTGITSNNAALAAAVTANTPAAAAK